MSRASHPALHMDIVRGRDGIRFFAIDRDRPDQCTQRPFAHPGECDEESDGWSCADFPGDWIAGLRAQIGPRVIATGGVDAPFGGGVGSVDDSARGVSLVLIASDGDEVDIELPDVAAPVTTIDSASPDGADVAIAWHATPAAASAVVELWTGFVGHRCHAADASSIRLPAWPGGDPQQIIVQAFAAPTTIATPFGDAEIWTGELAGETYTN